MSGTDDPIVLARFLRADGRLTSIPRRRAKLLVVLDRLSQEFDLGVTYREAEVVEVLTRFTTTTRRCGATWSTSSS